MYCVIKVKAAPNIDVYHLKFCYSWKKDLLHKQYDRHFRHRDIGSIIYQPRAVDDNLDACMCILIALKLFHLRINQKNITFIFVLQLQF